MTAYRFCTLTCDGCGEVHDDGMSFTAGDARATAYGWTTGTAKPLLGKQDFCPRCSRNGTSDGN